MAVIWGLAGQRLHIGDEPPASVAMQGRPLMQPDSGRDADYSKPPVGALPPASLSVHVGTRQNDLYGPITVTRDVKNLLFGLGRKNTSYVMRHYKADVFTFQPSGENAGCPNAGRFARDQNRGSMAVTIDYFNANGQGTFARV